MAPSSGKASAPTRAKAIVPSAREFYAGLGVLTVLGTVAMMRSGPTSSMAAAQPSLPAVASDHAASPSTEPPHTAQKKTRSQ